jgi:hypothetical protein
MKAEQNLKDKLDLTNFDVNQMSLWSFENEDYLEK